MVEHENLLKRAIERRAFELYEAASYPYGNDQDHWHQAEQELTMRGSDLTVKAEGVAVVIQFPINAEKNEQLVASISPWSVLLFTIADEPTTDVDDCTGMRKLMQYISLPQEVIPEQAMASFSNDAFTLRLPIVSVETALARSA